MHHPKTEIEAKRLESTSIMANIANEKISLDFTPLHRVDYFNQLGTKLFASNLTK